MSEADLQAVRYAARQKQSLRCDNDAPHIAVRRGGRWTVYQGCCNSWSCSRCGYIRATREYHRVQMGSELLRASGENLWFITLTAPGGDTSVAEAEENWYKGTTRVWNALRNQHKRAGGSWDYYCVTERQRRGHPHAHYIITATPRDTALTDVGAVLYEGRYQSEAGLYSWWLAERCDKHNIGTVHDIQPITDVERVSSYVSKYMFKSLLQDAWPKNWRRVRSSRTWYRPKESKAEEAFALLYGKDWDRLSQCGPNVIADSDVVFEHYNAYRAPNMKPRKTS